MRPVELVWIGRISQRLDFVQLFAALQVLVERFKFQRDNPFKWRSFGDPRQYIAETPGSVFVENRCIIAGVLGVVCSLGASLFVSSSGCPADWISSLPREKSQASLVVVRRWECSYAMMSVALDEALSLRAGELVCARQQVTVAAGLLARLLLRNFSLRTLSSNGHYVSEFPVVEPMKTEFFRGDTAQSAASWNEILHHVLFAHVRGSFTSSASFPIHSRCSKTNSKKRPVT